MAGDIRVEEKVIVISSRAPERADAVAESARQQGARILHRYGPRVMIAEVPEDRTEQVRAAVRDAEVTAAPQELSSLATADLDPTGALGLTAFRIRQSSEYIAAKERRPYDGMPWDAGGTLLPPDPPPDVRRLIASPAAEEGLRDVVIGTTSQQMTGSIAVGIIIVSGPTVELQFSAEESQQIITEVQNGLSWLTSIAPGANITWQYDIHLVQVDVPPREGLNGPEQEALWRDPAMVQLGYSGNWQGVFDYINQIKAQYSADWSYVGYFTKYPVEWFGYANIGGPRLVMQSPYDGWGPDNIDRVFVHETGHIFQAPDEYAASECNCGGSWGIYDQPNGNCALCAPGGGVECIMNSNSWSLCNWTPFHFGFPMPVINQLNSRFSAASISGIHATSSWPATTATVESFLPERE